MKMFGYSSPQQIIGKKFDQWGRKGMMIGVMKDFHFRSLQEVIKPLSMRIEPDGCSLISVNVSCKKYPATIAAIENKWKEMIPNRPFSYYFLDEFFDQQYRAEERFGKLFFNFAILAIFISCLGLLAWHLQHHAAYQRDRYSKSNGCIGIRNIVNLLSKDFLKLVIISFVIAAPVAWYFMHKWLKDFAYRTNMSWWVFALAGITRITYCYCYSKLPGNKSGNSEPGKKFENRIE